MVRLNGQNKHEYKGSETRKPEVNIEAMICTLRERFGTGRTHGWQSEKCYI